MRIGSLFSGYGGLDMAVAAHYGATVAWHVEFDKHPSAILAHHYPDIPNTNNENRQSLDRYGMNLGQALGVTPLEKP